MSVGAVLKRIREKNGLTQEQFADKIGVKRTTYISYENSKTKPDFDLIEKIAEIFDVSILDFSEDGENNSGVTWLEFNSIEPVYDAGYKRNPKILSGEEEFIIEYFRSLDDKEKKEFFEDVKNGYLDKKCGISEE